MTSTPKEKNHSLRRICVFCGSSLGRNSEYRVGARELGKTLAKNRITLVYGGGNFGLMGELAKTVLARSGYVIGIIPKNLYHRVQHLELSELHVARDMHKRKSMMYEISDGFVILPGGLGTLEEFFEIFTWYQLGFHLKPIGLLNIENYFVKLNTFLNHMVKEGFLKLQHKNAILVDDNPASLLTRMMNHEVVHIDKLR